MHSILHERFAETGNSDEQPQFCFELSGNRLADWDQPRKAWLYGCGTYGLLISSPYRRNGLSLEVILAATLFVSLRLVAPAFPPVNAALHDTGHRFRHVSIRAATSIGYRRVDVICPPRGSTVIVLGL